MTASPHPPNFHSPSLHVWRRRAQDEPSPLNQRNPVRIVEQLSVFLANKPGTLAEVCDALVAEKLNIYALTVSDTVDHAVVRMIVSDARRALALFEARGALVVENEVLMIESDNRPGSLSRIARVLSEHKINIDYSYLATLPSARRGLLILRVQNTAKAHRVLLQSGAIPGAGRMSAGRQRSQAAKIGDTPTGPATTDNGQPLTRRK